MDLWNVRDLQSPPINRCKCFLKEIDVKLFKSTLKDGIEYFNNQDLLSTEAAVLSRFIYRMKMKFRSSKDFKSLEKLNRALRNYLQINIPKILQNVLDLFPRSWEKETYYPTKNLIDFILVRLQGLGMLLRRILDTCKIASFLYRKRLHLGHFWSFAIVLFAIVSRIFVVVKSMIKFTCTIYGNLHPFSNKIPKGSRNWLPDDYQLPESLNDWLDIDWLDLDATIIEIPDDEPQIMNYFSLIDDDDDDDIEISDEYVVVNDDTVNDDLFVDLANVDSDDSVKICEDLNGFDAGIDAGEVIELIDDTIDNNSVINLDNTVIDSNNDFLPLSSSPSKELKKKPKKKRNSMPKHSPKKAALMKKIKLKRNRKKNNRKSNNSFS